MDVEAEVARTLVPAVQAAARDLGWQGDLDYWQEFSRPPQKEMGDLATNVAFGLASRLGRTPREVASAIVSKLTPTTLVESAEVAGPGFINLHLRREWLYDVLREVAARGPEYGRAAPHGKRVQVEFVSANPTGPLTLGHARNAAIGDVLARLLEFAGWSVEREYYFNDAGGQMDRFGASVEARYLQLMGLEAVVPEDGYHGDYVAALARDLVSEMGDEPLALPPRQRLERIRDAATRHVLDWIARSLERFGVRFDVYISERDLKERGEIDQAVQRLLRSGHAYVQDGAVWFRSTEFGDDKDRVLVRSNGAHTYFGADCAYLIDKFRRGFDHLIYVWGADHHGDVARLRGAAQALGFDPAGVEMLIYQWVSFLRNGSPVPMGKRSGNFVGLDELIDEVGADATRFTLLLRSSDSTLEFDIDVVKQETMENPVYYVQYGHARIASILRHAAERGVVLRPIEDVDLSVLSTEAELDLLRAIGEMPGLVLEAAELRGPHRLTHCAQELAARFHRFYTDCRVVTENEPLTQARLWLCTAAKQVIANVLALLGVSAPESMERFDA
ncbi:MAG: arginine--tRNA ligase [Actinomycetota bacterium]